jgi:predicted nucleic acid-binding protein
VTLVDTGPLVSLVDPQDAFHDTARAQLERLAPQGLCTCDAVVTEACFHLPHESQRRRLAAVLDRFDVTPLSAADPREFWRDVFAWVLKYQEHDPDWADGCIAVLSGQDVRLKVWTYDREFRTTWRRPDGTAIPMATR